jgi:transcriptional antiterminator
MTVKQLAEITKKSDRTVRTRIKKLLPEVKLVKGKSVKLTDDQTYTVLKSFESPFSTEKTSVRTEKTSVDYDKLSCAIAAAVTSAMLPIIRHLTVPNNQLQIEQDYYSLKGWCSKESIKLSFSEMQSYGRKCSQLSREKKIEIRKVPDEQFGHIGSYHVDVLQEIFKLN